jgi:WG containing repeat
MKFVLPLLLFISYSSFGQRQLEGTYDSRENVFTPTKGRKIRDFRYGVAPYTDPYNYLLGVIDTTGRIVLEPKYYEMEGFGGGVSRVTKKVEPWTITYGFIDTLGNEVLPPIYDNADTWYYRSMRFAEVLVVSENGKYGVFDYQGKKLTPLKYQSVWDFTGGLARVYHDDKVGFINKEGTEVIPTIYEQAKDFRGYLALVKKDGKYGWIDKQGKTIIPFEYEWASDFSGLWAKVKKDGKMEFIDKEGNPKLQTEFDGIGNYKSGLAWARKDGKWGFIDPEGNVVIPLIYTKTGNFEKGRAWVWKGDKWGHIDQTGKVTTPIIYERANDFGGQYTGDSLFSGVMLNGKYGKVGINGNLVIPCEYVGIDHFSMGLAKVKKQVGDTYKFGFVNYSGEEIVACIYDKVEKFGRGYEVSLVNKDGLWGLIDIKGKELIPCKYRRMDDQENGTYSVWDGKEHFIIDEMGKRVER